MVRIDANITAELQLRMPSGNETGANKLWIPGGNTSDIFPTDVNSVLVNCFYKQFDKADNIKGIFIENFNKYYKNKYNAGLI